MVISGHSARPVGVMANPCASELNQHNDQEALNKDGNTYDRREIDLNKEPC